MARIYSFQLAQARSLYLRACRLLAESERLLEVARYNSTPFFRLQMNKCSRDGISFTPPQRNRNAGGAL